MINNYNNTQVRRAYLQIYHIDKIQERFVIGIAWPQLRDEILQHFEMEMDLYGEDWPCKYMLLKINRSQLSSIEIEAIQFYVTDTAPLLLALKVNFEERILETLLDEIEIKQNQKKNEQPAPPLYI